jgi:hypothetical protein
LEKEKSKHLKKLAGEKKMNAQKLQRMKTKALENANKEIYSDDSSGTDYSGDQSPKKETI